jgi:hypothetical protein
MLLDSYWIPTGLLLDSRIPTGLPLDSSRNPTGVPESDRNRWGSDKYCNLCPDKRCLFRIKEPYAKYLAGVHNSGV